MTAQSLADVGIRHSVYDRLARRNAVVAVLRMLVPALALLGILYFVGVLFWAGLSQQFAAGGVAFDKNGIVIDAPRYQGVIADGTRYQVTASSATSALDAPDMLALKNARLVLTRTDGTTFTVTAPLADYNLSGQIVVVPGTAHVVDSRGTSGNLENSRFDWAAQTLVSSGGAQLTFSDGTTLAGSTLHYYAKLSKWVFTKPVLTTASNQGAQP